MTEILLPLGLTDKDMAMFRGIVTKANREQVHALHAYLCKEVMRRENHGTASTRL